ncbi:hypothetical protein DFJ74DRAFT_532297 [Hyaloraphidium curvatum]|nr:hypothetical protein DFJ74DRAFT_532297 [Hyaloraphidium curvatum]
MNDTADGADERNSPTSLPKAKRKSPAAEAVAALNALKAWPPAPPNASGTERKKWAAACRPLPRLLGALKKLGRDAETLPSPANPPADGSDWVEALEDAWADEAEDLAALAGLCLDTKVQAVFGVVADDATIVRTVRERVARDGAFEEVPEIPIDRFCIGNGPARPDGSHYGMLDHDLPALVSYVRSGLHSAVCSDLCLRLAVFADAKGPRHSMASGSIALDIYDTLCERFQLADRVKEHGWTEGQLAKLATDARCVLHLYDVLSAERRELAVTLAHNFIKLDEQLWPTLNSPAYPQSALVQRIQVRTILDRMNTRLLDVEWDRILRRTRTTNEPRCVWLRDYLDAMRIVKERDRRTRFSGLLPEARQEFEAAELERIAAEEVAAEKIASAYRSHVERRRRRAAVEARRALRERSATRLSATWKGYRARTEYGKALEERARRHDAASRLASFWKAVKVRRAYRILKEPWPPLQEPSVSGDEISVDYEMPVSGPADSLPFNWQDVALYVLRDQTSYGLHAQVHCGLRRIPPQGFRMAMKWTFSAVDKRGVEHPQREGRHTLGQSRFFSVMIPVSLADPLAHPEFSKRGRLVIRFRLTMIDLDLPASWTEFLSLRAYRERNERTIRAELDKVLATEKDIKKKGDFLVTAQELAKVAKKPDIELRLACSKLVGEDFNGNDRLVHHVTFDVAKVLADGSASNLGPALKWRGEPKLSFRFLLQKSGDDLGMFIGFYDLSGEQTPRVPKTFKRTYLVDFSLLSTKSDTYEDLDVPFEGTLPVSADVWADGKYYGFRSMPKWTAEALRDPSLGFFVETADGRRFTVVRVELEIGKEHDAVDRDRKSKDSSKESSKESETKDLAALVQKLAKDGRLEEALASASQSIRIQPQNIALYLERAVVRRRLGQLAQAATDLRAVLERTKSSEPDLRKRALLEYAELQRDEFAALPSPLPKRALTLLSTAQTNLAELLAMPGGRTKQALALEKRLTADLVECERQLAQSAESRPATGARVAKPCPRGQACTVDDCDLVHPKGWLPPSARVPSTGSDKKADSNSEAEAAYTTLLAWFRALLGEVSKGISNDLVRSIFAARPASSGPAGRGSGKGKELVRENGSLYAKQSRVGGQSSQPPAPSRSITGETAKPRGPGKAAALQVLLTAHTYRELLAIDAKDKVMAMFEGRALHQHQKKVADRVFEGRLNKKERIFYVELAANTYLITAIVLNHKGFSKTIAHAGGILEQIEFAGVVISTEAAGSPEGEVELDARLGGHAERVRDIVLAFRQDIAANPDMGANFFLPRRFLGNLDMLIEADPDTGRTSAVLTRQEAAAIELGCRRNVALFIKGSAGNGKTTVLSEIAKAIPGAVVLLPTSRLRDQVLRSYPEINVQTVRERIDQLWPQGWPRVTYSDFASAARTRGETDTDRIAGLWVDRFYLAWYGSWKTERGLRDEADLWEFLKETWTQPGGGAAGLARFFGPMLIDEAQSLTPLQIKILALSSGKPGSVIVGLDSKQSVGRESAARRTGVRTALAEACTVTRDKLEHHSVTLSINFRCPVGVLKVLDAVLQTWLKPFYKSDFDDFAVDAVIRSALWDSPPVLQCRNADAARRLIDASGLDFVVLRTGSKAPSDLSRAGHGPLLNLSLDECRGLEFDLLCVLDRPFSGIDPRLFRSLRMGAQMDEEQMERARDGITSWLVLMTRCMFGAIWIEDAHHPVVAALLEQGRALLLEAETDEQIASGVAMLRRARSWGSSATTWSSSRTFLSRPSWPCRWSSDSRARKAGSSSAVWRVCRSWSRGSGAATSPPDKRRAIGKPRRSGGSRRSCWTC